MLCAEQKYFQHHRNSGQSNRSITQANIEAAYRGDSDRKYVYHLLEVMGLLFAKMEVTKTNIYISIEEAKLSGLKYEVIGRLRDELSEDVVKCDA